MSLATTNRESDSDLTKDDGNYHLNQVCSKNVDSPRELPECFNGRGEVSGFHFRQVKRTLVGYIYEVTQGRLVHYEVFLRIINSRFNRVSYPSSKSFGLTAWTVSTLDEANRKYEQLINK